MKRIISLLLAALLLALSLSSCQLGENKSKKTYNASFIQLFDTVTVIKGQEESEAEFSRVSQELYDLIEKYHKLFDIYYEYSGINNLCTVNKHAGEAVKVSVELIDFLEFAKQLCLDCGGAVNIAMGSVLSIWHDRRTEGKTIPTVEELQAANAHVDIEKVIIDREELTVTLLDPEMKLDVGAIAKGYTASLAAKYLEDMGKEGYILSLGGNIVTVGEKENGERWRLGIENPFYSSGEGEEYLCRLELSGGYTLVTSGNYQRYYTFDGKRYHHIIDPETLFPKNDFTLVSVVARDSGTADALSTALFNMSVEEGKELLRSFGGAEAVWYTSNGEMIFSDGMSEFLID